MLLKEFNSKLNPTITVLQSPVNPRLYNNIQTTLFLACKNIIPLSLSIVTYHLNTHGSPHHPCHSPQSPPSAGFSAHPFHSMQIIPQASSTINRPPPMKQIVWQYQQDCLPAPNSPQLSQFSFILVRRAIQSYYVDDVPLVPQDDGNQQPIPYPRPCQ